MPIVDFLDFPYYPALQRSPGEHLGYRQLSDADKDAIVPIFEICQRREEPSVEQALQDIRQSSPQRPFILDLSKNQAPAPFVQKGKDLSAQDKKRIEAQAKAKASYDTELAKLLDPSQDFAAWRTLVATFSNCVPTIQFTDPASQRDVLVRQGLALAEAGSVAIRVTSESGAQVYSAIQALLKEMKLRDRLLIIFDCGQGRSRLDERAEFARNGIKLIVDKSDLKQEELRAVCMSSSFPLVGHNGLKPIENLDWDLWDGASESFSFLVSDYAATRRIHNPTTYVPADWRATVVFPYGNEWLIYRGLNANDPAGWVDGSRAILEQVGSMPAGVWGGDVLSAAAKGDIANANATRFWYAAKVNLHIHHQITEVPGALSGDDA